MHGKIQQAQGLEVFDNFCVVFTDFTDGDYKSEEEKAVVARNRDPVVFGFFSNDHTGLKHDRFYFITDWEDEYCDLTFIKMIEKMGKVGIKNPSHEISNDSAYLQEIVKDTIENMKSHGRREGSLVTQVAEVRAEFQQRIATIKKMEDEEKESSKSFFARLFSWKK